MQIKHPHNKGKYFLFCKECDRKRYCQNIPIPNHNYKKICSRGHEWVIEGITVERLNSAMNSAFDSAKIADIFSRNDAFYARLKGR